MSSEISESIAESALASSLKLAEKKQFGYLRLRVSERRLEFMFACRSGPNAYLGSISLGLVVVWSLSGIVNGFVWVFSDSLRHFSLVESGAFMVGFEI